MTRENKTGAKKRTRRSFSAEQKTRAVLSLWTERRKPAQICRELSITASLLELWQKKALEAIIVAMEPDRGPQVRAELPPRIEKILDRQTSGVPLTKLARRLEQAQDARPARKPAAGKAKTPNP